MNMNLLNRWGEACSPPHTPYLTFSSPQSPDMLFRDVAEIEIRAQSGLRSLDLTWTLHRNAFTTPFRSGLAPVQVGNRFVIRIPTADLHPGFYDLRATLDSGVKKNRRTKIHARPVTTVCTFGWHADQMPLADTRPADFAVFWGRALENLKSIPLAPTEGPMQHFNRAAIAKYNTTRACIPADYDPDGHVVEDVESCKVDFAGPDGGRVSGWLAKPLGDGPFPAMLVLPGAGYRGRPRPLEHARHGYLTLDIQIHGQDCEPDEQPRMEGYYDAQSWIPTESYYYYHVHLRCVQAINYLVSRPDVDTSRIAVVGGSQGGRLGIVVAGLDPRVKALVSCIANSPNMPYREWASRCSGFAAVGDKHPDPSLPTSHGMDVAGPPPIIDSPAMHCFAYYDPMNYAPDVHCPALFNAGLIDPVSPPYSVFAPFQRLASKDRTMVAIDGVGHDWSAAFDRRAWKWLDRVWAANAKAKGKG